MNLHNKTDPRVHQINTIKILKCFETGSKQYDLMKPCLLKSHDYDLLSLIHALNH